MRAKRRPESDREPGTVKRFLDEVRKQSVSPLDLLPHEDIREKLIDLTLNGVPESHSMEFRDVLSSMLDVLQDSDVSQVKVVVFGGGTGLSNIIGGDSRSEGWPKEPFTGLKQIFPQTRSIVCVTDDGGSTGQLLKDLPLIAIGDIRHVLLSSVQLRVLQRIYQLTVDEAREVVAALAQVFNYRFEHSPESPDQLCADSGADSLVLPRAARETIKELVVQLFEDPRLAPALNRPHCLGNLIIASAVYKFLDKDLTNEQIESKCDILHRPIYEGLQYLSLIIGVEAESVLPCTSTPSQLRIVYANGVQTRGEAKSSEARRGYAVQSVHVDYSGPVSTYDRVVREIVEADVLVLAPGSLYSSIIPVFKVPGIAEAVRKNKSALKLLVANLWVQAGETDQSLADPDRKFRVSDMIRAYERNIPGGTAGLFDQVLCISLKDVPASVIQRYAVEGKIPIYLDRAVVREHGYLPIECGIYSRKALAERGVIQHDPQSLAKVVKVLYRCRDAVKGPSKVASRVKNKAIPDEAARLTGRYSTLPCERYRQIRNRMGELEYSYPDTGDTGMGKIQLVDLLTEIIWKHHDIPLAHLGFTRGVRFIETKRWPRNQRWDNVYSFFDPDGMAITIRVDQYGDKTKLETAFLIALGQSLLGNYAEKKVVKEVAVDNDFVGKVYHLHLREECDRLSYFTTEQLDDYLRFSRMFPGKDLNHYTRLINGDEGFTPPGLLMGLMYAWYLENLQASHIEYKMTVMKIPHTDLIPDQKRMVVRRKKMISFLRDVVFA